MKHRTQFEGSDDDSDPGFDRPRSGQERIGYWMARVVFALFVGALVFVVIVLMGLRRRRSIIAPHILFWIVTPGQLYTVALIGGIVAAVLVVIFGMGRVNFYNPKR
jgi:uncharacterized membrane protein